MSRTRTPTFALVLALAATTASAGEPITENSRPLELILHPGDALPDPRVTASVHNPTSKRVFLQIKVPEVFALSAELLDDSGKPVEGMHDWATRGAPFMDHRFHELEAGAALAMDTFAMDDARSQATGGGMTWDLREQRGRTVTLTYTFQASCEGRTTDPPSNTLLQTDSARPKKVKDVFCGELVSPPLAIDVPPWTRDNVLWTLEREPVISGDAYPTLTTDALTHASEQVRQNAAFSLGELGRAEAATALVPLLADPVREVRGSAARTLGKLNNPAALDALHAAKDSEQDDWVRSMIYKAIKAIDG